MSRPRRNTRIPLRYRESSPPRLSPNRNEPKRRKIDPKNVDRNDVDQALAVIVPASECIDESPTLISTELPHFDANEVPNRRGTSRYTNLSELGFFKLFFSDSVVEIISKATNSYAEFELQNHPPPPLHETRRWVSTTSSEIYVFLGIMIYFGLYPLAIRADYWRIHNLSRFMAFKRYEQIFRYFSLDEKTTPPPPNAPWFHRIQRVADLIRTACQHSYYPSSHIAIDEAMVAFRGRSKHTVKLKNKPIDTGYKIWCIGDHGYIWSWLFHSREQGVESFAKSEQTEWPRASDSHTHSAFLAPTFALVLRLANQLPKELIFCVYLDNLFLNLLVAQCLLSMGIYCMGTTRKKAVGVPETLQNYLNDNSNLLWDSTIAKIIDSNTLCFVWQDNKPVCALTTAHSLHRTEDRIQRKRKCPRITSENARILNPVFKGQPYKDLFIPKAIDDYNHHMKGVDQADQLRANVTCHRKQNYRNWWPLFYFLVDISCVNAYLLWKWSSIANTAQDKRSHTGHRDFMNALSTQLMHLNDHKEPSPTPPTPGLSSHHIRVHDKPQGRCEWGRLHPPGCPRKRSSKKRAFGEDITLRVNNGVDETILGGSRTRMKCSKCQIHLCNEGECWRQYHRSIGVNIDR